MTEPLTAKSILDTMKSLKDKFPDPIYNGIEMNALSLRIVKDVFKDVSALKDGSLLVGQFTGMPVYVNLSIPDNIARFVAMDGTTKDVYIGSNKE